MPLKRTQFAIGTLALIPVCMLGLSFAKGKTPRSIPAVAIASITAESAQQHVVVLASDAMMGRATPSPELDSCAQYIARNFQHIGVEPVNGSYFNTYTLVQEVLGEYNAMSVFNGDQVALVPGVDYEPMPGSGSGTVKGVMVFAGYGFSDSAYDYDDYQGLDVHGKIVVMFTGAPQFISKKANGNLRAARSRNKIQTAAKRGAIGVVMIESVVEMRSLSLSGSRWPSLNPKQSIRDLPYFLENQERVERRIPAVIFNNNISGELFKGDLNKFAELRREIEDEEEPVRYSMEGVSAIITVELTKLYHTAYNVAGVVRGSLFPDEFVIVGAHYDHIGITSNSNRGAGSQRLDTINNGADDNASGTAGLLLMAKAFASIPIEQRPARSILFVAFSAEELGLLGSRAYVEHPAIPTEKIVAMLNMDMIGRNAPDSVTVVGRNRSPELAEIIEEANRADRMTLADNGEYLFYRSDQANFARINIPVLFFTTGLHEDYHSTSDHIEKLDMEKLARITRLCFRTSWMIADAESRPTYVVPTDD